MGGKRGGTERVSDRGNFRENVWEKNIFINRGNNTPKIGKKVKLH